jgi:hypothetical protein
MYPAYSTQITNVHTSLVSKPQYRPHESFAQIDPAISVKVQKMKPRIANRYATDSSESLLGSVLRKRGVLTRIVVDVGETSGVELELSSSSARTHGGLSCLTLMPG